MRRTRASKSVVPTVTKIISSVPRQRWRTAGHERGAGLADGSSEESPGKDRGWGGGEQLLPLHEIEVGDMAHELAGAAQAMDARPRLDEDDPRPEELGQQAHRQRHRG